ncbi:hypothetical protein LTR65_008107 [Meristemomyces frigidus]
MVTPAFGFSAGDFIAAVELICKAAKALRDTSGASQQYQQAAAELETLGRILTQVQGLTPTSSNAVTVQKILFCAHTCHLPLAHFLEKIRRYEQYLCPPSHGIPPQPWTVSGIKKKITWAINMEKELPKLRASITPQLASIGLLLQLEELERGCSMERSVQITLSLAQDLLPKVEDLKAVMLNEVASRDQMASLTKLTEQTSLQRTTQASEILDAVNSGQSSVISLTARMEDRFERLESLLVQTVRLGDNKANPSLLGFPSHTPTPSRLGRPASSGFTLEPKMTPFARTC